MLFSPATALIHGRRQIRNVASDFNGFLPAKFGKGKHLQLRPTENYWAALKQTVHAGGRQKKSFDALLDWIHTKICKIDQQIIINLFRLIKNSILKFAADSPYWTFKWFDIFQPHYCFSLLRIHYNNIFAFKPFLDRFDLFWLVIKCFIGLVPNFLLRVLHYELPFLFF